MIRRIMFVALFAASVVPVLAQDNEVKSCTTEQWRALGDEFCKSAEERNDRWKLSIGYLPVGPLDVMRPDAEFQYFSDGHIRAWRNQYYLDYIVGNAVGMPDRYRTNPFPDTWVLCCTNDTELFQAQDFLGRVGDRYRLWADRRLEHFETKGVPLSASLEYRMAGSLWGAFSFQMSQQTVAKLTEREGYVRIESIERFLAQERFNFSSPIPFWYVGASRHRRESEIEHSQQAFQFTFLFKYDVLRDHPHWSIIPQAGVDVFLIRQKEYRVDRFFDWRIFGGEGHPSNWAHEADEVDSRTLETVDWHQYFRPVLGGTIELWFGRKWESIGVVADARYHVTDVTSVISYESLDAPYDIEMEHRPFTLSVGLICRF